MFNPQKKIIIALDFDNISKSVETIQELGSYVEIYKVGLQLFCAEGLKVLNLLTNLNKQIFFDCKLHDIPNTAARASEALVAHGVTFFNVHTLGGYKMMNACVQSANKIASDNGLLSPIILGVTLLTSIDQEILSKELDIKCDITNYIVRLAMLAKEAGLSGVVASAKEVNEIKKHCGKDFIVLTPGIRPLWSASNDQERIVTPRDAIKAGADYLVIGRPVTCSNDPVKAINLIIDEVNEAVEVNN